MKFIYKILKKILNIKPVDNPFDLWGKDCWELSVPKDFPMLFRGLIGFLPENSIMRFELGSPHGDLKSFFLSNSIQEEIFIPKGTIWPKPQVFNIPVTNTNLIKLSELTEHYAEPEVATHFHVYLGNDVLIDWYDAFYDPMCISKRIPEDKIINLCDSLSITYKEHLENV